MNITAIILAGLLLAGCDLEQESRNDLFRYCLYRAAPASAEAIRVCQQVAWPQATEKGQTP